MTRSRLGFCAPCAFICINPAQIPDMGYGIGMVIVRSFIGSYKDYHARYPKPIFTERERAALAWTEAVIVISFRIVPGRSIRWTVTFFRFSG